MSKLNISSFKEKIDNKHLDEEEIKKKIEKKQDIIGRNDNFKKNSIDETYPEYILKNLLKSLKPLSCFHNVVKKKF